MQKAHLTGRQRAAAVFAGIFGHLLFAAGWLSLGFVLLGGGITLLFGGTIGGIGSLFGDVQALADFLGSAGNVIGVIIIVLGVGSLILILLAVLISAAILRSGKVRKPWAVTWSSIAIVAILDVPLLIGYLIIAGQVTDTKVAGPVFLGPLIGIVGTLLVGALVWLWMTFVRRGSASEFADVKVSGASSAPAVETAEAETPVVEKPVVEKPAKPAN
jgi:hypothetical protein